MRRRKGEGEEGSRYTFLATPLSCSEGDHTPECLSFTKTLVCYISPISLLILVFLLAFIFYKVV